MDTFRAIAFVDGGRWHVHCLERDIGASGAAIEDACRHLLHTIDADREMGRELHGVPFGNIEPAPAEIVTRWEKAGGGGEHQIRSSTAIVNVRRGLAQSTALTSICP